jgi:hypothetical protein
MVRLHLDMTSFWVYGVGNHVTWLLYKLQLTLILKLRPYLPYHSPSFDVSFISTYNKQGVATLPQPCHLDYRSLKLPQFTQADSSSPQADCYLSLGHDHWQTLHHVNSAPLAIICLSIRDRHPKTTS